MDYYKIINRTAQISANKRNIVDLEAEIWSQDVNVTKFVLALETTGPAIDLTNATVRVAMVYNQDGTDVKIEAAGIVEDVATQKIAYIMDNRLAGFEGLIVAGFYVTLSTGQRIDVQNVIFNMRKSLLDEDLEAAKESYYQTFDDIVADVQSEGETQKQAINAVLPTVNSYADTQKQAIDGVVSDVSGYADVKKQAIHNIVDDVQSTGDTAKADINATLPTLQTQVSELSESITENYSELKEDLVNSVNLIDLTSSLTIKGYLDAHGVFRNHNSLFSSDYIDIKNTNIAFKAYGIKSESVTTTVGNVCFYNEEKIFISAISYSEINPGIIYGSNNKIPACAKYMRLCSTKNDSYFICYDKLSIPSQLVLDLTDKLFKNWGYINANGTVIPIAENKWSYTDAIDVHLYNQIEYSLYCGIGSLIFAKYNQNMELIGSLPATETGYYLYQGVYDVSDAYYVKMVCYYDNVNIYAKAYAVDLGEKQKSDIKYQHCINKPFNFNGKKALFYGDSITAGFTSGSSVTQNNYPKLFSQSVGMSYTNYGIGGSCFSHIYNEVQTIINTIKTTDLSTLTNADYIFIAGGVNDWGTGASKEELVNALSTLSDFINNNNLQEKVIIITPINEGGKSTPETPKMTLQETRNIITHFGLENGYSVIQGYLFPFPNSDDDIDYINKMYGDKLHPSELGYRVYAKSLKTVLC